MRYNLERLADKLCRREKTILVLMTALFTAVITAACFWKYRIFAYNGLDLAIFNQVFWNMIHGRFFAGSIHPHSYLGDHAELTMPLLVPLYALWPDPRMLLLLQAVALALPAWPLWLIAKRRLKDSGLPAAAVRLLPLAVAAAYLACPFVQNIGLDEFHMLPFALLPLFLTLLEYEKGRRGPFLVFAALALLTREDVAVVLLALGVLAWIERRTLFWRIAPVLLSGAWFVAAMKIISRFAPAGGYKYSVYYGWLGATPAEMLLNAVRHPLVLLAHLLTLGNLEMVLGFALPFVFLIFFRPARLILAVGPLLQFILGAPGGGEVIMQLHYAALFLPALFLAFIEGLKATPNLAQKMSKRGFSEAPALLTAVIMLGSLYGMVMLGPLPAVLGRLAAPGDDLARADAAEALIARVPADASVAASYALLPRLSSRAGLYSPHYQFLGVTQFALTPYALPPDNRFLALDTGDLLLYQAQFLNTGWSEPHFAGGYARLRQAAGSLVFSRDTFQLYDKQASVRPRPSRRLEQPREQAFCDGIRLDAAGVESRIEPETGKKLVSLITYWSAGSGTKDDLVMRLRLNGPAGEAVERQLPLANSLTPTSELAGQVVAGEIILDLTAMPAGEYSPEIILEDQKAAAHLDGIRSMYRDVTGRKVCGSALLRPFKL